MNQVLDHKGHLASFTVDYDETSDTYLFTDGYTDRYYIKRKSINGLSFQYRQKPKQGFSGSHDYIMGEFYIVVYAGTKIDMLYLYLIGNDTEDLRKKELDYVSRYNISIRGEIKEIEKALRKEILGVNISDFTD